MSSREGVAPQVKMAIWLMLQDCYEFGLKENGSLSRCRSLGCMQEQILKYHLQTAAALLFNTNSIRVIYNADKQAHQGKMFWHL